MDWVNVQAGECLACVQNHRSLDQQNKETSYGE